MQHLLIPNLEGYGEKVIQGTEKLFLIEYGIK